MPNDLSSRQWHLDTANTTAVLWQGNIKVKSMVFSKYASGNECIVQDRNGKVVWDVVGPADLEPVIINNVGWIEGLILNTLAGGLLTVYLD